MDFASSVISVEKRSAGAEGAASARKADRWATKHMVEALILTAIRAREAKRRRPAGDAESLSENE